MKRLGCLLKEIESLEDPSSVHDVIACANKRLKGMENIIEQKRIEDALACGTLVCSLKRLPMKEGIFATSFPITAVFESYGTEDTSTPEFCEIYDECLLSLKDIKCKCQVFRNDTQWTPVDGSYEEAEDVSDANFEHMTTEHWVYWKPIVPEEGQTYYVVTQQTNGVYTLQCQLNQGVVEPYGKFKEFVGFEYPQDLSKVPCKLNTGDSDESDTEE